MSTLLLTLTGASRSCEADSATRTESPTQSIMLVVAALIAGAATVQRSPRPGQRTLATSTPNSTADCAASDENLVLLSKIMCASLTQADTEWCGPAWKNVTAKGDWPNQAVYMTNLLSALQANSTCLSTPFARWTVTWLNSSKMSDPSYGALNFMSTYEVFQVQYYDMPRKAGTRIESPDTLGRKCWAFAYLKQMWQPDMLQNALARAGLSMPAFIAEYNRAVPLTMGLCAKVIANCFVNASYDPSRSGTCPLQVESFHYLGFERENALRLFSVAYPW